MNKAQFFSRRCDELGLYIDFNFTPYYVNIPTWWNTLCTIRHRFLACTTVMPVQALTRWLSLVNY